LPLTSKAATTAGPTQEMKKVLLKRKELHGNYSTKGPKPYEV